MWYSERSAWFGCETTKKEKGQTALIENKLSGLRPFCWFPKLRSSWHFVWVIFSVSECYHCCWQIFTVYWFLNKGTTLITCSPNYWLHFLPVVRSDYLSPLEMFSRTMWKCVCSQKLVKRIKGFWFCFFGFVCWLWFGFFWKLPIIKKSCNHPWKLTNSSVRYMSIH